MKQEATGGICPLFFGLFEQLRTGLPYLWFPVQFLTPVACPPEKDGKKSGRRR
jgi:hypothetical protein